MIIYRGPSRIDGSPIVAIAVGVKTPSTNRKTGAMVQTYIIRSDMSPIEAASNGADVAICGACPLKKQRNRARTCYVNLGHGPLGIYKKLIRGGYSEATDLAAIGRNRLVRLGAYGDPAAVPFRVWEELLSEARGWTGYTHQSRNKGLRDVLEFCQVSADTEAQATEAHLAGFGSFRVLGPDANPLPFEVECPADGIVTCSSCLACSGKGSANVWIRAHGPGRKNLPVLSGRPLRLETVR